MGRGAHPHEFFTEQSVVRNTNLGPLRKSFRKLKILSITQYLVEQAPSPAKYSRGRLFYMIFAEV